MHRWTRLISTAPAALLAQGPAFAQGVTPAPAAKPLIPDWVWLVGIVILVALALWYFLRTRRG
jgi:hypothetical protein